MPPFVYILTGDSPTAAHRYLTGAGLSILSLRRYHPAATVVCLCDAPLARACRDGGLPLARLVDRWIDCEVPGGPVHRSRFLKTTLRGRLDGPFVYLDADSVVAGPLDALMACDAELGICPDSFFAEATGVSPAWLGPYHRRLGWSPSPRYFAGGVFAAADTPRVHALFAAWHARWRESLAIGLVVDQPALNRAIAEIEPEIRTYPTAYNYQSTPQEPVLPDDVRILSFLASLDGPLPVAYEAALAALARHGTIAADALEGLTRPGTRLSRRSAGRLTRWAGGFRARLIRTTTRLGLRDVRQH